MMGTWVDETDIESFMGRTFTSDTTPASGDIADMITAREAEIHILLHMIGVSNLGTYSTTYVKRTVCYGVAGDIIQGQIARLNPQNTDQSQATEDFGGRSIAQRLNTFLGEWERRKTALRKRGAFLLYDSTFEHYPTAPRNFDNEAIDDIRGEVSDRFDA